jgi:hypothetical protein
MAGREEVRARACRRYARIGGADLGCGWARARWGRSGLRVGRVAAGSAALGREPINRK